MSWKNTWILTGLAAGLFAFIFLVERHWPATGVVRPAQPLLAKFRASTATSMTLRRGNEFTLQLQRTNDNWAFTKPEYPAAYSLVQSFLETLERVVPATRIEPREILARKQTQVDFGFDAPPISISLERGGERVEIRFGSRTPAGDQVYAQVGTDPGIFVVSSELLDRVPKTANDWRNAALFDFGDASPDRLEIVHHETGVNYELQIDPTNKLWKLTRPPHRADQNQVRELLRRIQQGRVAEFVTDEPGADNEAYGLQTPEYEVTLASGAQVRHLQFGKSPTNNPALVYARLLTHSNIVLVAKSTVEPLATPYAELRDRQVFAFAPELIDLIEVRGSESFVVRRDGTGWKAGDTAADPEFVAAWLHDLSLLDASAFVRDVVTDWKPYRLGTGQIGQIQYTLRTTATNGSGPTNVFIGELAFGTNGTDEIGFARRWDESSVYAIRPLDFSRLPSASWQFRDHRVWNFATNQVERITIREGESVREVIRQANGEWIAVRGWAKDPNSFALEEITRYLGMLTTRTWLGHGTDVRAKFNFGPSPVQFIVALGGDKPQTLTMEFSPTNLTQALTTVDGEPAVFEFPWVLYADLQRYFELKAPVQKKGP